MGRWTRCLLGLLLLTSLAPFLGRWTPFPRSGVRQSSPQELEDVMEIAQQLGLHCRGDREDGLVQIRLLVSESPLSWELANGLSIERGKDSDWSGTVAVFRGQQSFPILSPPMTVWGKFRLYGDRSLMDKLTGREAF